MQHINDYDNDFLQRQKKNPCLLVWPYTWSEFCTDTEDPSSLKLFATMHLKRQVLGNVFGRTFSAPSDRIAHRNHIVGTSCCQLPVEHNIIITRVISSHMGRMFSVTPGIYTFTEWAEIIGQSHGFLVYWDTWYIYTFPEWAEIIGQTHGSLVYWSHPVYMHVLSGQK